MAEPKNDFDLYESSMFDIKEYFKKKIFGVKMKMIMIMIIKMKLMRMNIIILILVIDLKRHFINVLKIQRMRVRKQ